MTTDHHKARRTGPARSSSIGTLLYVMLGPIVWAAHLGVIYAFQSVACAVARDAVMADKATELSAFVIAGATLVAFAALCLCAVFRYRAAALFGAAAWPEIQQRAHASMMRSLVLLSAFAVAAQAGVALLVPTCGTLR